MASVRSCPHILQFLLPNSRHLSIQTQHLILKSNFLPSFHPCLTVSPHLKRHVHQAVVQNASSSDASNDGVVPPQTLSINHGVIPILTFGNDGNMVLKSRPEFEDKYTLFDETKPKSKPNKTNTSRTEASVPKWKGGSPEPRTKPKKLSSAPKYSKAARRFYNENFRKTERLAKVLAKAGVASRRASEDVVFAGRVSVNGVICKIPQTGVDIGKDEILVDGKPIPRKESIKFYFAVNKPKGYICSTVSEKQKPVLSLVNDYLNVWMKKNPTLPKPRLFTVGRLDVATTGLILITNDGDFAQRVSHPSSGLTKEYVVTVDQKITKRQLAIASEGTVIDGVKCVPNFVEIMENNSSKELFKLRITVSEGRNHEVREIIGNAGLNVKALKRVRIGGFRIPKSLVLGKCEVLTPPQIEQLFSSKN